MIHLKPIHSSLIPKQHAFYDRVGYFQRKHPRLCLCKSNDSDSDAPPPPEGDTRQQELLARIAQLQTQKVRLTDYLDERSAYLSQFAEDANAEIDQVGENALKELDEAGARIMENIESQMQAFEESVGLNKDEIEENEKKLADFEDQMEEERNEGLFFKTLGKKQPVDKAKAKEDVEKIKLLNKETAESKTRRNIYLALMGIVVVGITNALISSPSDWGKSAVLGAILVGLLSQVILSLGLCHTNKHPNLATVYCPTFSAPERYMTQCLVYLTNKSRAKHLRGEEMQARFHYHSTRDELAELFCTNFCILQKLSSTQNSDSE